jgi:CelD/BcsL family acetyltransferase involved in cellulose biosynthesis
MPGLRAFELESVAELRFHAAAWDDLWRRSDATTPLLRAELIAQWMDHFAARARFRAVVVEDGGQWVAALPLVGRRAAWMLSAGATVGNPWSSHADLLWDSARTADGLVGDALVRASARLPWPLLWLEGALVNAPQWRALRAALGRAGMTTVCRRRWHTGRLSVDRDWQACRRRWSHAHRRQLARSFKRLAARGDVALQFCDRLPPDEVESQLRRAMEVEDAGWKGAAGTSVLGTPGMFDFLLRQARQLAEWGQLALATLDCGPAAVACCYGLAAKGVFHSCKIGYDPRWADCSPGQLLRYCLLERFHAGGEYRAWDFVGPLNDAQRRWRPDEHLVGRLMVAPRRGLGRIALRTYERLRPDGATTETARAEARRRRERKNRKTLSG